jgi:LysM repeat protein
METVATPTFSPSAGAVNIGTSVTISCATTGAEIHYTTDGTTPSASSPVYSSAITIDAAQTIKAIAIKTGMTNSSVASASYTIAKVATPNFSVPAGEVESGTTVTITCSTSGATIHYTTDGTDPTSSSPTYSAPIEITTAITLKAIAVKANMADSSIKSASYTVAVVLTRYAGWVVNSRPVGGITFNKALLEGMEDLQTDTVADKACPSGFKYTGTAGTSVGNSRPTWAYPAQYGECTEVWNGLSWSPATEDYTLKQVDIDGIPYNIYIMTTKMVGDVGQEYPWPFR